MGKLKGLFNKKETSQNVVQEEDLSFSFSKEPKLTVIHDVDKEISLLMLLPEIKLDLIKRYNPNKFDLYECAFGKGGEL